MKYERVFLKAYDSVAEARQCIAGAHARFEAARHGNEQFVGMDFVEPAIDFVGIRALEAMGAAPVMLAQDTCYMCTRGGFATKHVWVTRYASDERYASWLTPI